MVGTSYLIFVVGAVLKGKWIKDKPFELPL